MAAQEFRGRIAVRGAAPGKLRDRWLEAAFCSIAGGDLALYAVPGSRSGSSSRSRSGSSSGFGSTDSEGGALLLRVSLGSAVACLADAGSQRFKAPDKGVGVFLRVDVTSGSDTHLVLYAATDAETRDCLFASVLAQGAAAGEHAPKDHQWSKKHFGTPTWCDVCDRFIWGLGKQGFQCAECKLSAHAKCRDSTGPNCGDSPIQKREHSPAEIEKQQVLMKSQEIMSTLAKSQGRDITGGNIAESTTDDDDVDDADDADDRTDGGDGVSGKKPGVDIAACWACEVCTMVNADMEATRCEACDTLREVADRNFGKRRDTAVVSAGKHEDEVLEVTVSDPISVTSAGTRSDHVHAIKQGMKKYHQITASPSVVLFELEIDDCENLCFRLKARSDGSKKAAIYSATLMVPETYPNGDFMLFSEDGDVRELGKGTICGFLQSTMEEFATKQKIPRDQLFPRFDIVNGSVETYTGINTDGETDGSDYDPGSAELDGTGTTDLTGSLGESLGASLTESTYLHDAFDDYDDSVAGQMAETARQRLEQHVAGVRKSCGVNSAGLYADGAGDLILRISLPVKSFVAKNVAPVWGLDWEKPVVASFSISGPYFLDGVDPPALNLFQSSDKDLNARTLTDHSSFGLVWQVSNRLRTWLKQVWPPRGDLAFFTKVLSSLQDTIASCNKHCVICDKDLGFVGLKPAVCDSMLCTFSHEQYGLGADVATEIRRYPQVVDMLITFSAAATTSPDRFTPFPNGVEVKEHDKETRKTTVHSFMKGSDSKDAPKVATVLQKMPGLDDMVPHAQDAATLRAYLDQIDPLCFPLLRWIVTSNRAHLTYIPREKQIRGLNTEHQYIFMSTPPEREKQFQELKAKHGSIICFHGSALSNWHCILRMGLKNYSNTPFMSCGAAYGAGIYLGADSSTSMGYSHGGTGWTNSKVCTSSMQCLAVCELINDGYQANPYYVIQKEEHVITRMFCLYPGSGSASVHGRDIVLPDLTADMT